MIGSGVVHWANLQSRAQRNGADRGIRDARTWKSEVMVAGREGEKSRTGVGAGMVCWRRKTNRAHSAVPESALIGQDKIVLRPDPPSQPPTFHPPARAHPRAAEEAGQPRNPGAPVTNARPPHATLDHLLFFEPAFITALMISGATSHPAISPPMSNKPQKFQSMISHGLNNVAEQPDPIRLDVHGQIPPWLTGTLYRTGPGTFSVPTKHGYDWKPVHWFDGLGLNHKFDIKPNGEVWYRSRKACPGAEVSIMENGAYLSYSFDASDPCETYFQKFTTFFRRAIGISPQRDEEDNVSVTLTPNMPGFAVPSSHTTNKVNDVEYIVAKTDADALSILDPETLQALGPAHYEDLNPALKGASFSAAHACIDPINGDLFNHVYKFGSSGGYTAFRIRGHGPDRGKLAVLANITDAPAAYLHSSSLTEKYFVLCIWQADIKWWVFPTSL